MSVTAHVLEISRADMMMVKAEGDEVQDTRETDSL